jgi:hypothetical protein
MYRREKLVDIMSMTGYRERPVRDCAYYFLKLDFEIIKPLLIYKFEEKQEELQREDEYVELLMSEGNMMGTIYASMNDNVNQDAVRNKVNTAVKKAW